MTTFLYHDLPIGHIPSTPATPYFREPIGFVASKLLVKWAERFGKVVSYKQEQNGQIIQNIIPVHKTEYSQISTSSKTELYLHTEAAFHPYKPKYVLLLCLRGDSTAFTTYANIEDILANLKPETISVLRQKIFKTSIDDSFRTNGEKDKDILLSVLGLNGWDNDSIIYDKALMKGTNESACLALDELQNAIDNNTKEVALKTGDLFVIDNNTTVHGRKPFQPRYDGTDRWVQRVFVVDELPPSSDIDGQVITTDFVV